VASSIVRGFPTREELLQTLRRSSLPSVIVEGSGDFFAYRRIEESLQATGVSFIVAGGRETVLWLHEQRQHFSQIRSIFIVDMDMWIYSGVPVHHQSGSMITTAGYSIENDLLADGDVLTYMTLVESAAFSRDMAVLTGWFSCIVTMILAGQQVGFAYHIDRIVDSAGNVTPSASANLNNAAGPNTTLMQDPIGRLRGKTLMSLVLRYLSYPGRHARHTAATLMDAAAARNGPNMTRLKTEIERCL
jgi:hypothetical protein